MNSNKDKYEPPRALWLDDINGGVGICNNGSSASEEHSCTEGNTIYLAECLNGYGAYNSCLSGSTASHDCSPGMAVGENCYLGSNVY
jgi:hypothetical protein